MMDITAISDLHGYYPELPGGDLLIVAGDLTARDNLKGYDIFNEWIFESNYIKKIVIAGNHDNLLQKGVFDITSPKDNTIFLDPSVEYLCDSGTEFEGLKIWGTPHSLLFQGVNPRCTAFMGNEEELDVNYSHIPDDIDVLISHTPPYGILDKNRNGEWCGSVSLRNAMHRVQPKYLICGHIHECGGKEVDLTMTKVINASHVNERYKPVNKPVRIVL